MDSLDDLRRTFFQECDELLGDLESGLLAIRDGAAGPDTVNAVFRAVHSIKGGAGAFQLTDLVSFAHGYENVLDALRDGRLDPRPDLADLMLRAADVLADLVRAAGEEGGAAPEWTATLEELDRVLGDPGAGAGQDLAALGFAPIMIAIGGEEEDAAGAPAGWRLRMTPRASLYQSANDPLPLLRELRAQGVEGIECDLSALPDLDALDPEGAALSWTGTFAGDPARIREVFEFVDEDCAVEIEPLGAAPAPEAEGAEAPGDAGDRGAPGADGPPAAGSAPAEPLPAPAALAAVPAARAPEEPPAATIRVDLDRVDRLINLVGELVISQAMLGQRAAESDLGSAPGVASGLDELRRLTRDIQDSVMAIRAQPVKGLFMRMGRIVRELAAATAKSVRLRTEGEMTEVDKTVVERLADPLTHLIRNAVDHGLETPERRLAAGKPAEGNVTLSAAHRSGRIVIEIEDDGAGVDRARVREIAESRGLIAPDAQLTDAEVDNLLFLPGFSTARAISDISGRGVGMDVVKRSIQALGGRLALASRPGLGTRLTMSLPLTLAVLDGMVVTVADQTLVVPLTAVVETLKPRPSEIHRLGAGPRLLAIRGGLVPVVDAGLALGFGPAPPFAEDEDDAAGGVAILVETAHGAQFALHVGGIQDQRQVVIKSLESNYGPVPGVAAATILGDGRVALILDLDTLLADPLGEPLASVAWGSPGDGLAA